MADITTIGRKMKIKLENENKVEKESSRWGAKLT